MIVFLKKYLDAIETDLEETEVYVYVWDILHKKRDPILTNVFDAATSAHDPWARMVGDLVSELGVGVFDGPKSRLKKRLTGSGTRGVEAKEAVCVSKLHANPSSLVQTSATRM